MPVVPCYSGKKMLKSNFNEHALATARSVGCDVKPTTDTFTQSNRHFATRRGFALLLPYVRRSKFTLYGERGHLSQRASASGLYGVCGERDQRARAIEVLHHPVV
jgi:hypothetical protein